MAESNDAIQEAIERFNSLGEQAGGADCADRVEVSETGLGEAGLVLPRVVEEDCARLFHSDGDAAESAAGNEECGAIAAACTRKEGSNVSEDIGAMQVNEPAPNLNIRFFHLAARQRTREDNPRRRRRRRSSAASTTQQNENSPHNSGQSSASTAGVLRRALSTELGVGSLGSLFPRRNNPLTASTSSSPVINATLVEEPEVVVAERMLLSEKKKMMIIGVVIFVVVIVAVVIILVLVLDTKRDDETAVVPETRRPTMAPTFDNRPTLQIVQERGSIRCGSAENGTTRALFFQDLCRAVAAVVLGGDESNLEVVNDKWFPALENREIDLLIAGATLTLERNVREQSTGSGFAFSTPYFYDGLRYQGMEKYVVCAEEMKRYDECSTLSICVSAVYSTSYNTISALFPPEFYKVAPSIDDMRNMFLNGTCNVLAVESLQLTAIFHDSDAVIEELTSGNRSLTNEPLAIATSTHDTQWSDIMNWVIYSLVYGEIQGLQQDLSRCQKSVSTREAYSTLPFANAVYCVGNYGEIFSKDFDDAIRSEINEINDGTGMHYCIPFGEIGGPGTEDNMFLNTTLVSIKATSELRCGVIATDGVLEGNLTKFGEDYCRTMAAAIFYGKADAVNCKSFESDEQAYAALLDRDLDVVVGGKIDMVNDLDLGLTFSTPYFITNQLEFHDIGFYSFVTREDDFMFSLFVDTIVLSTFYAYDKGITKEEGFEMPLITIFGPDMLWALRDAILFSGNYVELFRHHFYPPPRRNGLNEDSANPQFLPRPGISSHFTDS